MPKPKLTDAIKRKAQDKFVENEPQPRTNGHPDIATSGNIDIQTSGHTDVRKRTTVYLPPDLHRQLKRASVDHDREMSELIEAAVREYLPTLAD